MKQLFDLLPILAFFGVYLATDIYTATIALMVAAVGQVAFLKLKGRRIGGQMWMVFWGALLFGTMTLAFRNPLFIQWKPSIVYWLMAVALAGSRFVGKGDIVQRTLGKTLALPERAWRALSWGWAGAMAAAGFANLYVAYQFSEATWVFYKFASAFALPVLLVLGSFGYLAATAQMPSLQGGREADGKPAKANGDSQATGPAGAESGGAA